MSWVWCTCRALRTREREAAPVRAQDAVPRASLHTASRLQDEIVEALARGRRCKARTLLQVVDWSGRAVGGAGARAALHGAHRQA